MNRPSTRNVVSGEASTSFPISAAGRVVPNPLRGTPIGYMGHSTESAPRNLAGATGREVPSRVRSTPMQTMAPNRHNSAVTAGYLGHSTEARVPYTSNVTALEAIAPTSMHAEALHVPRTSIPVRMGMDSTTSSIRSNRSPPWSPAVNSAAPTVATVSDFNMVAPSREVSLHSAAPPIDSSSSRSPADRRIRPRIMPLAAQAPVAGTGGLDVCFVMDCTSSMAPWLEAAKTTVKDMIAALPADVPNKRVAFVGYRDFSDGSAQVQRFTEDTESVVRFIDAQDAIGGADIPEDVAGGLAAALGLAWKAETRTLVLVTDAPCHGQKYHNEMDDYPDGDPTGLSMVRLIQALRRSHIDFTIVQLASKTDKMQKMLRTVYESAAGPENIRKYELRDLRDIIEEAGGEAAINSSPRATIPLLSAAITPTVQASIRSTKARSPMCSVPIRTAMTEAIEVPVAALSAPAFHHDARTTEVY